ncbi:hypothetical protein [Croceicoccus sp. BE223]|uniref:hypothetical protein n=1 Tax=Croceicoccus sp. BE223 TaxID=2817716 RepID=UPI00285B248F|nr:hypothetical protein [Croceicoccus sp. BE223]MDR7103946.1 hypothetical protein [Croceicoccus sp. BE223]
MSGDSRDYSLDVSEYLFRLTTESLRLLSNDTKTYQSITSLVEKLAGPTAADALAQHDIETLRQHLSKIPTGGPIRIHLQIARTSADNLFEAKRRLGEALGTDLTVADAISMLLFDYVVDKSATKLLTQMGIEPGESAKKSAEESGKIVPLR